MNKPTLADLTAFSTVATHRSFRRAADALGVSRSSLSHAVLALERELGGLCRIKQFLDLKRVDFIEVNLPKFA